MPSSVPTFSPRSESTAAKLLSVSRSPSGGRSGTRRISKSPKSAAAPARAKAAVSPTRCASCAPSSMATICEPYCGTIRRLTAGAISSAS